MQMSNCAALEIVGDMWRLITSDASYHGIEAYGLKTYWQDGVYHEIRLDTGPDWKPVSQLYAK